MSELKDSGNRTEFESGAVRDIQEGKGRCDLLPLNEVSILLIKTNYDNAGDILRSIHEFINHHDDTYLYESIMLFSEFRWENIETCILEVAKHYEDGARKYGDNNWRKGIPVSRYIDSGIRHLLKYYRGDNDEPHDRAFVWNMLGAIWTFNNRPECIDI